jgi:hypothetical protein
VYLDSKGIAKMLDIGGITSFFIVLVMIMLPNAYMFRYLYSVYIYFHTSNFNYKLVFSLSPSLSLTLCVLQISAISATYTHSQLLKLYYLLSSIYVHLRVNEQNYSRAIKTKEVKPQKSTEQLKMKIL